MRPVLAWPFVLGKTVIDDRFLLKDIAGHRDVSPKRKTDPGPAFDWPRYRKLIARKGN